MGVLEHDVAAVGLGDHAHDRQPQAAGGAAVARAADEALEDALAQLGGHAGAVVLHGEDDVAVVGGDVGADARAVGRVADRVLHEVQRHPVELVAGAVDHRVVGVDGHVVAVGDRAELGRDLDHHATHVGRLVGLLAVGVGARQQQQVAHQAAHALRRAQRRLGRLAALAVEHVGQQLEVGEDRGQRRAQLVRGVGHELALALQGALGLLARGLQPVEHRLQRVRELCDLVVGPRLGQRLRRVARALDVVGGGRQPGDGRHRPPAEQHSAEQREQRAAEHARGEEEADAPDGGLDVGHLARVLDDERKDEPLGVADRDAALAGLHAEAADARGARQEDAEVGGVLRLAQDLARGLRDPDHGLVGRGVLVEVGAHERDPVGRRHEPDAVGEVVDGGGLLVVEVRAHARGGDLADDHREAGEDDQRQSRGEQRQAPPDRDAFKHAGRIPRRGWCAAAAPRRRPRACGAGSRRTPRSCSWWRRGRSPRPPRAGAGAARRCARCA